MTEVFLIGSSIVLGAWLGYHGMRIMIRRVRSGHWLPYYVVLLACSLTAQAGNIIGPSGQWAWYSHAASSPYWTDTASGRVSVWDMEGTNATSTLDVGTASNHMALKPYATNGPAQVITGTNSEGRVEHAYSFNGTTQWMLGGTNGLDCTSGAVMAWVKISGAGANPGTVFSLGKIGGDIYNMDLHTVLKTSYAGWAQTNGTWMYRDSDAYTFTAGTWYHLAWLQDGTKTKLYINGVGGGDAYDLGAAYTKWMHQYFLTAGVDSAAIGRSCWASYPYYFLGTLDDVRVYTTLPTLPQLTNIVTHTHPTNNLEARP